MAQSKYFPNLENGVDIADVDVVEEAFSSVETDLSNVRTSIAAIGTNLNKHISESEVLKNKGIANGYAPLDSNGLVPSKHLNNAVPHTTASGYPISLTDHLEGESVIDYKIYGNIVQDGTPTPDNPIEVQSVGNLVTDTSSEYYGKYDVPITVNDETKHIYLDEPLRKIGDYADYIDFKNQKVIRQTTFRTFDGTEKFGSYSTAKGFSYVNSDMKSQKVGDGYCNYYLRIIAISNVGIRFGISSNVLYFCNVYTDDKPLTVAGWKEKLSNWNANGNPLIVYYILDTPTEESITVPDLTIPNSEVTNVLAGTSISPSSIDVTYYQDINKVITELKSAILAQGGNV